MMGERAFFKLRVAEGQEAEYVERHKNVWPEVQADLESAGVQEMSIWMRGREVFLMMVCDDYKAATAALDASPKSIEWEKWMAPMLETGAGGEYDPAAAYPDGLPEVFRWQAMASASSTPLGLRHHADQVSHDQWLAMTAPEPVLEPDLPIVDAHHHLWDKHPVRAAVRPRPCRPWRCCC